MNRDEVKGKSRRTERQDQTGGGRSERRSTLNDKGAADEAAGKTRAFGHAKRKVGEAVEHIGKTVKK